MAENNKKKPINFTTHDGKTYRKTFDKKGNPKYSVTDKKSKINKFIDAKTFVSESSRHHAKERIRLLKEEKQRIIDDAAAKKLLEENTAKKQKKDAEITARVDAQRSKKFAEEKEKQRIASVKQAQELDRFLNTVLDESDQLAQVRTKIIFIYNS